MYVGKILNKINREHSEQLTKSWPCGPRHDVTLCSDFMSGYPGTVSSLVRSIILREEYFLWVGEDGMVFSMSIILGEDKFFAMGWERMVGVQLRFSKRDTYLLPIAIKKAYKIKTMVKSLRTTAEKKSNYT